MLISDPPHIQVIITLSDRNVSRTTENPETHLFTVSFDSRKRPRDMILSAKSQR